MRCSFYADDQLYDLRLRTRMGHWYRFGEQPSSALLAFWIQLQVLWEDRLLAHCPGGFLNLTRACRRRSGDSHNHTRCFLLIHMSLSCRHK